MGYLFSYSDKHIRNNVMINDKSYEIEWKLKGEMVFKDKRQSWSFRIGVKEHENREITDSFYIGLRRSNLEFSQPVVSWMKNSSFDLKWDFSQKKFEPIRQEYIFGKKYPLKGRRAALKLDFGFIWESNRIYSGELREKELNNFTIVLRPNIEF